MLAAPAAAELARNRLSDDDVADMAAMIFFIKRNES